ncbi:hypothetical protein GLOIN_2v1778161 [Rhizophagus clarus]|uniref:MACPF domain-containing protein n=1 Tax=Rhizophagus clarus TaxID=94130 RepID=A0A8H3QBH4_9GLOM|nr:hypothetical protein GLOIN_2v1778161 [Rhizophagus clarus]
MSSDVMVFIKIIDDSPQSKVCYLDLDDRLPDIRKKLKVYNIINDIMLFSKKGNDEFAEVVREDEKNFKLNDIIEVINKGHHLYLMNNSNPSWNVLNDECKLDYGRTMSIEGIKKADKRAFIMKNCELVKTGNEGYKKGRLAFESKADWMKKKNLFINVDGINMQNFIEFGLLIGSSHTINEEINSTYQYTEIGKAILKFNKENLELTDNFKNDVISAIQSNDHEKIKEIIKEYGQFIPTEVILGGRVYFKDIKVLSEKSADKTTEGSLKMNVCSTNAKIGRNTNDLKKSSNFYSSDSMRILGGEHPDSENFDEKKWIESLKDFRTWECIEFKNPINIFRLLPYDLPGMYRILELSDIPSRISKIIQNKDADCDIFASVINAENSRKIFFNCQIFHASGSNEKPSVLIHGVQKEFRRCKNKLKINIIVTGYDIDFFSNISNIDVELIKKEYNSQSKCEFDSITLQIEHKLIEKGIPFFGIPILSNLNTLTIGHNFRKLNNELKIDAFSYCSKTNRYVVLPNFTFSLFILKSPTSNSHEPFKFDLRRKPYVEFKEPNPRYISLYLLKGLYYLEREYIDELKRLLGSTLDKQQRSK